MSFEKFLKNGLCDEIVITQVERVVLKGPLKHNKEVSEYLYEQGFRCVRGGPEVDEGYKTTGRFHTIMDRTVEKT